MSNNDGPLPGDIYFVDPHSVVIDEGAFDGRCENSQEVVEMAMSFHTHGQRRPVECRRAIDGSLLLVHGFVRTAAARLLRSGFKHMDPAVDKEVAIKNKKFMLKVVIEHVHDEEANELASATASMEGNEWPSVS